MASKIYTTLLCIYDVNYCLFTSTQSSPFSISCKAGLVVMNPLTFYDGGSEFPQNIITNLTLKLPQSAHYFI